VAKGKNNGSLEVVDAFSIALLNGSALAARDELWPTRPRASAACDSSGLFTFAKRVSDVVNYLPALLAAQ
jgi:hypothetical protein